MHWTYEPFAQDSDLEQGDILAPTAELRTTLNKIHPHFDHDKYLGFAVATQSCDLVRRRGGEAKARYISIASIRSLTQVLPRLLAQVAPSLGSGLFPASTKLEAKRFLARLFDQNEQGLGLFYLHEEAEIGLGEPAVVFLRVKVALSQEHYPELVQARRGRLTAEFRGKFAWLIGNLYARAAARDWADADGGKKKVERLIDRFTKEEIPGAGPMWLDDVLVEAGKSNGVDFNADRESLMKTLEALRPKPKIDQVVDVVSSESQRALAPDGEKVKALRHLLEEELQGLLSVLRGESEGETRERVVQAVERLLVEAQSVLSPDAEKLERLRQRLLNSALLRRLTRS